MARFILAVFVFVVLACSALLAQHATPDSGPAGMTVQLDNEAMTVFRIRLAPHEKTPMHDVSARALVWLTDSHLRDIAPDGAVTEMRRKAGEVEWITARRHAGENLGDAPIEFLAIVSKHRRPAH